MSLSTLALPFLASAQCKQSNAPRWVLAPGQAMTIQVNHSGKLEVVSGRIWLTLTGDPECPVGSDDVVLTAQQSMLLCSGQEIVVECWPLEVDQEAHVVWLPDSP